MGCLGCGQRRQGKTLAQKERASKAREVREWRRAQYGQLQKTEQTAKEANNEEKKDGT